VSPASLGDGGTFVWPLRPPLEMTGRPNGRTAWQC
jgi:hypothetical protein